MALPLRGEPDPGEWRPQVPRDVVGECLERGDVEDTYVPGVVLGRRRGRVARQAVEGEEEGGKGLATPRRRVDERVLAPRDGLPAASLRIRFGVSVARK